MHKWSLARYLIDAKKCVDSIWFIDICFELINHIDIRKKIDDCRRQFYIYLGVIIDKTFSKTIKKTLKKEYKIIYDIYYERDKNQAHKDDDYKSPKAETRNKLIELMKKQLTHIKEICKDNLPKEVTLSYVPHDKDLCRIAFNISPEFEKQILSFNHPMYNKPPENAVAGNPIPVISDTEDIPKENSFQKNHAVVLKSGITDFETIQNGQDFSILCNAYHQNTNIWFEYDEKNLHKLIDKFIYRPSLYFNGLDALKKMSLFKDLEKNQVREKIKLTLKNYELYLDVFLCKNNYSLVEEIKIEPFVPLFVFQDVIIELTYRVTHDTSEQKSNHHFATHKKVIKINTSGQGDSSKLEENASDMKITSIKGFVVLQR